MYERSASSKWYSGRYSEDLYDYEDYATDDEISFDTLPKLVLDPRVDLNCSEASLDNWLEHVDYPEPTWEEEVVRVEEKIKNGTSSALKGIPGPIEEPDKEESSSPIAQCEVPPPRIMEGVQRQGDDETSVFPHLAPEPERVAMEVEGPKCNSRVPAEPVGHTVRLPPYPTVSCRITPTGEFSSAFWEVLKVFDSEAAAQVSGAAETVYYFG